MSTVDTMDRSDALSPAPYERGTAAEPWLPTLQQISAALRLRMDAQVVFVPAEDEPAQPTLFELAPETENEDEQGVEPETARPATAPATQRVVTSVVPAGHPLAISMRQGLLLLVFSALLAGLLPSAWNWYSAVQLDTVTPLVPVARFAAQQASQQIAADSPAVVLADTAATLVGLEPYWPVRLAAGFTAMGEWINWPLRWLSVWLVYGLGVFVVCSLFGTSTTLQHFFAATSYAAVPLLLTGLYFVPVLGAVAVLAGLVWSVLVYVHAVRGVTGLETFHAVLGVIAPAAIFALLNFLAALGLLAFVYWLIF